MKVLFRVDKENNEVVAVFPEIPANGRISYCMCYSHVGQHSSFSFDYLSKTRPATEAEYESLKRELESEPFNYELAVRTRLSPAMRKSFIKEWQRAYLSQR